MNILIPDSWLREYLKTDASPEEIKKCLSLCGPSIERVEKIKSDYIYHIEITSNRPDMASVLGIAKEAVAILPRFGIKAKLILSDIEKTSKLTIKPEKELPLKVEIKNEKLCSRFTAIILSDVIIKTSPDLIKDRLEKSGIRAINNVVDISNYLMKLFGQPVHTFDYDKIKGAVMILRESRIGESITTLDNKTFTLTNEDIVIEDKSGRLIDLCGIMGGKNSEVDANTKRVLLFVQTYDPVRIRKTSMRLGQRTEAATLFEKNLDPENVLPTLFYGIYLFKELAGAKPAGKIIDIYPYPYKPKTISIKTDFINERIGIKLSTDEIISILKSLNFNLNFQHEIKNTIVINIPSNRSKDIKIKEDIVEEVARLYGYHKLPSNLPAGQIPLAKKQTILSLEQKIKTTLKYWGFTEVYNYSFISKTLIEKAGLNPADHLKIANPLTAEMEYMRTSLIPSILENVRCNQYLKKSLALFELSKIYSRKTDDLPKEESRLVLTCQSDFFSLKGIITSLFSELGITDVKENIVETWQFGHPKQSLILKKSEEVIAYIASLHPQIATNFEIKDKLFIAEVYFETMASYFQPIKKYHPLPLFPPVIEDLTLIINNETKIGPVIKEMYKQFVTKIEFLGKYKNTITLRVTYQNPEKNLSSEEIKTLREKIISSLEAKFKIKLKN